MGISLDFPCFFIGMIMWINREKKRKTPLCSLPFLPYRFSGQAMSFFGKNGTGDIVSYFHKKINTLGKCKALENARFAIFGAQKSYAHDSQPTDSQPVENKTPAPPAFYALWAEVMPGLSTKNGKLSTCKSGEWKKKAPVSLPLAVFLDTARRFPYNGSCKKKSIQVSRRVFSAEEGNAGAFGWKR